MFMNLGMRMFVFFYNYSGLRYEKKVVVLVKRLSMRLLFMYLGILFCFVFVYV